MILDSSAIVAILFEEPEGEALAQKLGIAGHKGVAAPTLVETSLVLVREFDSLSRTVLERFIQEVELVVIPFGQAHWRAAADAFQRFGKGRHPAGLNFGDCMSYATAKLADRPLLYVGDDFSKTDIRTA